MLSTISRCEGDKQLIIYGCPSVVSFAKFHELVTSYGLASSYEEVIRKLQCILLWN